MNWFGKLVEETDPRNLDLSKKSFFGISFGKGVPIEVVASHLLGRLLGNYKLLIVDEFLRINRVPEGEVCQGLQELEKVLGACDKVFGPTERIKVSDFMGSSSYLKLYEGIKETVINDPILLNRTIRTVPKKYRYQQNYLEYPLKEYACVSFLCNNGHEIKFGPRKEMVYDRVIKQFVPSMGYAYLPVTYALNTRKLKPVVPYVPSSMGLDPRNHRILIGNDGIEKAQEKLKNSRMAALRFYDGLSSVACNILTGKTPPSLNGMMKNDSARYKDIIAKMTTEYVLKPLQGELS